MFPVVFQHAAYGLAQRAYLFRPLHDGRAFLSGGPRQGCCRELGYLKQAIGERDLAALCLGLQPVAAGDAAERGGQISAGHAEDM